MGKLKGHVLRVKLFLSGESIKLNKFIESKMSIVKKNLRATKGKKRWRRNIDVTDLLEDVQELERNEKLQKKAQEKLKDKKLFFVDTQPDKKIKQREALDPNRFKKKPSSIPLSKAEEKKLNKIAKKIKEKDEKRDQQFNQNHSAPNDPWNDGEKKRSKAKEVPALDIKFPVVLPPHQGQSYNPTSKAHKALLNKVVVEEEEKDEREGITEFWSENPAKEAPPKRKRAKSLIEQLEQEERQKKKILKQQNQDFMYLKNIVKKMKKEDEEHKLEIEERKKQQEEEKKLIEEGKLIKNHRIGRGKYYHKGTDFQLVGDLKPTLRQLNTSGNLLRDHYDGIFRRNLLTPATGEKKKKSRFPKYKMHSTDRSGKRDDDELGVFK